MKMNTYDNICSIDLACYTWQTLSNYHRRTYGNTIQEIYNATKNKKIKIEEFSIWSNYHLFYCPQSYCQTS